MAAAMGPHTAKRSVACCKNIAQKAGDMTVSWRLVESLVNVYVDSTDTNR
jgi:hypothetical protein